MRMRGGLAAVGALVTVALLAGCSAAPSHEEVTERFSIELAAGPGEPSDWAELAAGLAEDAFAGRCGTETYRSQLKEPSLTYAWDATCSMYFEGDMSSEQLSRARENVARTASENVGR
uniref:hypothetical protein n=1 Tax=Microbacterium proteolyticum TaxID=1572644 RepID=UPI002415C5EF|nr:hypothetical protein [Microbacterium proteolyticum]